MSEPQAGDPPIRIGISACLLGRKVRYDGGHKQDHFITDTLGQYFEWVPVCPEVEIKLGIPRPTLRLERHGDRLRLVMVRDSRDLTRAMESYATRRVAALAAEDLCGYILKRGSPSCGMERVQIYTSDGHPSGKGRGLFAAALLDRFPYLPVEEEGRLHDPALRENWITRVFAFRRVRSLFGGSWTIGQLVAFHAAHKLLLMAHSPKTLKELGAMVAAAKSAKRGELGKTYASQFMTALAKIATRAKNTNVLQHILGYFKRDLDPASRAELLGYIEAYRRGEVPLVVPLVLVAHYVRILNIGYLRDQVYLNPHPRELALRNHV